MKKILLICLAGLLLVVAASYGGIKLFEYKQAEHDREIQQDRVAFFKANLPEFNGDIKGEMDYYYPSRLVTSNKLSNITYDYHSISLVATENLFYSGFAKNYLVISGKFKTDQPYTFTLTVHVDNDDHPQKINYFDEDIGVSVQILNQKGDVVNPS